MTEHQHPAPRAALDIGVHLRNAPSRQPTACADCAARSADATTLVGRRRRVGIRRSADLAPPRWRQRGALLATRTGRSARAESGLRERPKPMKRACRPTIGSRPLASTIAGCCRRRSARSRVVHSERLAGLDRDASLRRMADVPEVHETLIVGGLMVGAEDGACTVVRRRALMDAGGSSGQAPRWRLMTPSPPTCSTGRGSRCTVGLTSRRKG